MQWGMRSGGSLVIPLDHDRTNGRCPHGQCGVDILSKADSRFLDDQSFDRMRKCRLAGGTPGGIVDLDDQRTGLKVYSSYFRKVFLASNWTELMSSLLTRDSTERRRNTDLWRSRRAPGTGG